LAGLALVDPLFEFLRIFIKEEEGETSNELLLAGGAHLDSILLLLCNELKNLNRLPAVLVALVDRGEGVGLAGFVHAFFNPLLWVLVFFLGVISGQDFDTGHVRLIEDLVFFIQEGNGLSGSLVFIDTSLCLVEEGLLLDN